MASFQSKILGGLLLALAVFHFVAASPVGATQGINRQIGYQGFLKTTTGEAVPDGDYDIVLNIYDIESGGAPLWTGTHASANGNPVTIDNGFFHVLLGSGIGNTMTVDFTQDEYYLGITVGADDEMTPRHRIGASGYAFNSHNLSGYTSSDLPLSGDITGTLSTAAIAANVIDSLKIFDGSVLDADISDSAAISWLKINKTGAKLSDLDAPDYAGNAGKALAVNGSGGLSWVDIENPIAAGLTTQYFRGDKTWATLDTSVVPENGNVYYTTVRFDTDFGAKTTDDLAEGTNLYYTDERFDSGFSLKTTDDLAEGSNLYYTDELTRNALSAAEPLEYNSSNGQFSLSQATTTTAGYLSALDWNTFNSKLGTSLGDGLIWIGNASNIASAVAISGDATVSNTGTLTIGTNAITSGKILDGTIVDSDINTSAAIVLSKLANGSNIVTSLAAPSGSNANGGSIANNVLTLSLADDTNPGLVSTTTQTFAGDKTFNGALTFNSSTVAVPNNLNFDSNTLFVDAANNRVGIGTVTPETNLAIHGTGADVILEMKADETYRDVGFNFKTPNYASAGITEIRFRNETGNLDFRVGSANQLRVLNSGGIRISDAYVLPTADGSTNQVMKTNGAGALSWANDSGVSSLAAPSGSNADGGSISGTTLTLSLADDTNPGLVSTSAQTFAGDKTFNGAFTFNNFTVSTPNNLNFDSNTLFIDAANNRIGIGTVNPGQKLSVAGAIESTSGGFKFPDGTIQTTAGITSTQWTTNGANIYYNTGNVGIGTVSPNQKLHIMDTVGSANILISGRSTGAGTGSGIFFHHDDSPSVARYKTKILAVGNGYYGQSDLYFVLDNTNNDSHADIATDTKMVITKTGNIGIGTTNPSAKLHITPSTAAALLIDPYGSSAGNTGEVRFAELAANGANYAGFKSADTLAANVLWTLPNADGASGQVLSTSGSGALSWVTSGSQWTTSGSNIYYNSGNVIVGHTATINGSGYTPKTQITGGATTLGVYAFAGDTNGGRLILGKSKNGTVGTLSMPLSSDTLGAISFSGAGTTQFEQGAAIYANATENWTSTSRGSKLIFQTTANGATANSDRLIIDQNGNVGIGTTTPGTALDVVGGIKTTGGVELTNSVPGVTTNKLYNSGGTLYWNGNAVGSGTGTVDYVQAQMTTNQTGVKLGDDIKFNSNIGGNIPYNTTTGEFTLTAGKTYNLSASPELLSFTGSGSYATFQWVDSGNNALVTNAGAGTSIPATYTLNSAPQTKAELIYTPSANTNVKLRVTGAANGTDTVTVNSNRSSYARITQIGTTALAGGLSMSSLSAAIAANSLDNTNYSQTWNWSTQTTGNALTLNANALTTGTALAIQSSYASGNSTNGLLYVANTGAVTNGIIARIQSNSTAGSGLTVLANGNVGIGITSPAATLDVAGNIQATPSDYVFAYDTTTQAIATANTWQNLTFSTNGQLNGWTHTAGNADFVCNRTGKYLVEYTLGASQTDAPPTIRKFESRITVGGTEVVGSQLGFNPPPSSQVGQPTKSIILDLTAGQTLAIQITGDSTTVSIKPTSGQSSTLVSASLTITRLN